MKIMKIKTFYLGQMMGCAYLTWNEETKEAFLFDCGGEDLNNLFAFISANELTLKKVIFTHGHHDHIGGLKKLLQHIPDVDVYIGEEEKEFFTKANLNLSEFLGTSFIYEGKVHYVKNGEMIGDFEVIDTPGHTIGSKCYYNSKEKIMISGDTLFRRSYGRYDLPTGNGQVLFQSLRKICTEYPGETKVYSGHTEVTTLGEEKAFLEMNGLI
jgi:hydroxyacylglutathione hydrolase